VVPLFNPGAVERERVTPVALMAFRVTVELMIPSPVVVPPMPLVIFSALPVVNAVPLMVKISAVVTESAVIVSTLVVVLVEVWVNCPVPEDMVRPALAASVRVPARFNAPVVATKSVPVLPMLVMMLAFIFKSPEKELVEEAVSAPSTVSASPVRRVSLALR
jgi:hypothetical protein